MRPLAGAALGLFFGGVIGVIVGSRPVFHWEMAGLALLPFTCLGGLTAGTLGATRGLVIGGLAGSFSFGTLWLGLCKIASLPPGDPWGIPVAGTIAVVIASIVSGIAASLICRTAKQQK